MKIIKGSKQILSRWHLFLSVRIYKYCLLPCWMSLGGLTKKRGCAATTSLHDQRLSWSHYPAKKTSRVNKMNEGRFFFFSLYQRACCAGQCYILVAWVENSITTETKYKEERSVVLLVQHSRQAQQFISLPWRPDRQNRQTRHCCRPWFRRGIG